MTENEIINGWTFEETVKIAENLMEAESNMLKWDILRHLRDFLENYKDELEQYRAIGTVEEFKRAKEMEAVYGQVKWERDIAISQLEEIGVALGQKMDEFKALKEKSVAKKPRFYAHNYYCTECGNLVGNNEFEWQRFLYCDKCGQKLDWQ